MGTLIGHLDADCFYCSAERVRSPGLRGVPVGVLGNQGAVVIAKSYELKACGVTTGMPIWEAVPRCPEAVFIKRDFRWYEALSRRMLAIVREASPRVEYYSIDEFFFDASTLPQTFGCSLPDAAAALQQRILREVGVPVSLGVSRSRTLAKLASDARKPFGCTILLDPDAIREFLMGLDVDEIAGIAAKSRQKLAEHGVKTCWDMARADRRVIRRLLTIKGETITAELNGEAVTPILTERPRHQRIGRGGSLGGATDDMAVLVAWVIRNTERLIEELDFHQVHTRRLTLWLEQKTSPGWGGRVVLPEPTAAFAIIASAGKWILQRGKLAGLVSGMHLEADMLSPRGNRQLVLFDCPDELGDAVAAVKAAINQRLGRFTVRSGDTLPLNELYDDSACNYDICDVHGKMCF